MPYKKKAAPGTNQFNELIDQLPEKKRKIHGQVQFRHDLLEPQKRVNYQSEYDRLQGGKKLSGLDVNTKSRMQELQQKTRQPLKGEPSHRICSTTFYTNIILEYIEMESYKQRKKLLEEKYGKLINLKTIQ